jgi:hypothetical protein
MKKLIITILALVFFVNLYTFSFAQESVSANQITTESSLATQSVWNNKIPITVKFTTNFDSDNVEITWDAPSGIDVTSHQAKFLKVVAGQTYTYTGYITPTNPGNYSISSNVIAWQFNTNYTASSFVTLKLNDKLLVDPTPADYTGMLILKYVIFVLGGAGILYLFFILFKKFSKIFIKWLRPPL